MGKKALKKLALRMTGLPEAAKKAPRKRASTKRSK